MKIPEIRTRHSRRELKRPHTTVTVSNGKVSLRTASGHVVQFKASVFRSRMEAVCDKVFERSLAT